MTLRWSQMVTQEQYSFSVEWDFRDFSFLVLPKGGGHHVNVDHMLFTLQAWNRLEFDTAISCNGLQRRLCNSQSPSLHATLPLKQKQFFRGSKY